MAFHIRDPETDALARKLAAKRGIGITAAVKEALREVVEREEDQSEVRERVRRIQERVASYPKTGLEADKAFYDSLYDD